MVLGVVRLMVRRSGIHGPIWSWIYQKFLVLVQSEVFYIFAYLVRLVRIFLKRLCLPVDGSMHHMVSTVNVQKTMPQQVSVVSTTRVTVHKILSLVFNAANSTNKILQNCQILQTSFLSPIQFSSILSHFNNFELKIATSAKSTWSIFRGENKVKMNGSNFEPSKNDMHMLARVIVPFDDFFSHYNVPPV